MNNPSIETIQALIKVALSALQESGLSCLHDFTVDLKPDGPCFELAMAGLEKAIEELDKFNG